MIKVAENLYVGNDEDARHNAFNEMSFVHACKTSHQQGVGYIGNLAKDHPLYLVYERGRELFLNIIDAKFPLSPNFGDPLFKAAFDFIDKKINDIEVLVHCNQGLSRSPSIALAYMAKKGLLPSESYKEASEEFKKIYPDYNPGVGIVHYLENHWSHILSL